MLIDQTVLVKWNAKTKAHYVDLGYTFTKMGDSFEVDVNDLTKGSNVSVIVRCDYCGKEYQKCWYNYLKENEESTVHKDCCNACKHIKIQETAEIKYGVNTVFKLDKVKEKIENTNIRKYGVVNPFMSDEIKDRIVQTNVEKYGVPSPLQNKDILNKVKNTCLERYGVDYYIRTQRFYGADNPHWKGGVLAHGNERATSEYIDWRTSVFQKDLYTCQCCGKKSHKGAPVVLNAHHIKNWRDYPEDRYDIQNGITLCEDCHMLFHKIFGKRNNNEQQLQSFINDYGKKIC